MSETQVEGQTEYIDRGDSFSSKASRQSNHQTQSSSLASKRKRPTTDDNSALPVRSTPNSRRGPNPKHLTSNSLADSDTGDMSDGKNEARALRVLEIMNDFRTLQVHISSLVTRQESNAPDQQAYYLDGYVVLRQCSAEAQAILATYYQPGSLGLEDGRIPDTEVQKATLQRIILDASTRRFQAHKIYLRAAAGMRWVQLRKQVLAGYATSDKLTAALSAIDTRLRAELTNITDESVVNDLRDADRRKNYWIDEDPALERMLAWIRRQR